MGACATETASPRLAAFAGSSDLSDVAVVAKRPRAHATTSVPTRKATAGLRMASAASPLPETEHELPKLQVLTLFKGPRPRRFARVPTHTVGVHPEQREYPRASLRLPLRLRSVDGVEESIL